MTVLLGAGAGFVALSSYLFHLIIDSNREIKQSRSTPLPMD